MSKDRSGLPGICTPVTHLVCVSVGAPGPAHGAASAWLDIVSDARANCANVMTNGFRIAAVRCFINAPVHTNIDERTGRMRRRLDYTETSPAILAWNCGTP